MKKIITYAADMLNVKEASFIKGIIIKNKYDSFSGYVTSIKGKFHCINPYEDHFGNSTVDLTELIEKNRDFNFYQL